MLFGQGCDLAQPGIACRVKAALALNHFHQKCRRGLKAGRWIVEACFQLLGGINIRTKIAVICLMIDIAQGHPGTIALACVAGSRQCTQGHAVKTVGEGNHVASPGNLARQFQCRFNSVGTRRACKHHAIIKVAWLQDQRFEGLKKSGLCICVHIKPVRHAIRHDVVNQSLLELRMVVPVVECRTARQKINITGAILSGHVTALRGCEHRWEGAAVTAHG